MVSIGAVDDDKDKPVTPFRRILPQVLAGTAKNFLLVGIGTSISYATIIIPALLGGKESITMTDEDASWFGSVCFIAQPIGSLMSGVIMDPIGRKKAMMIVNLPHIAAWIMMWCAQDLTTLFIANAFLGLGNGLMEAPIITYIGEICEPSVRGVLVSYSSVFASVGIFGVFLLGSVLHWRIAAAVCLTVPLITIMVITLIPESPVWLLSKGRNDDALKSLCWLRGWVKPNLVMKEFNQLVKYNENNFKCKICADSGVDLLPADICVHQNQSRWKRIVKSIADLKTRGTLRPLILSSLFFTISAMTSLSAIRPNMINIFKAFNMTIDAHWATVGVGILSILGGLICMTLVRSTGKRPIVLVCMAGSCASTFLLGLYAFYRIPHQTSTYTSVEIAGTPSSTPLVLFVIMVLCNMIGLVPVSWVIVSEIFPYRTRGNACGIVAAVCYIVNFVATKTYINVEATFHIYGAFYFYSGITFLGLIYLYLALPETENRKHEDIEAEFAEKDMKCFADDFVARKIKSALNRKSGKNEKGKNGSYNLSNGIPLDDHVYYNKAFDEMTENGRHVTAK